MFSCKPFLTIIKIAKIKYINENTSVIIKNRILKIFWVFVPRDLVLWKTINNIALIEKTIIVIEKLCMCFITKFKFITFINNIVISIAKFAIIDINK